VELQIENRAKLRRAQAAADREQGRLKLGDGLLAAERTGCWRLEVLAGDLIRAARGRRPGRAAGRQELETGATARGGIERATGRRGSSGRRGDGTRGGQGLDGTRISDRDRIKDDRGQNGNQQRCRGELAAAVTSREPKRALIPC
jgi:hypothetical protein